MRTIKRLDLFLLKAFLPLFIMTFGICLFIFVMQILWLYIDDIVGKGIELHFILQLFFYAAMRLVPQALPLAILFASLMTFGNLGERYELLAIKASGVSLMRIMRPLIIFLIFISFIAFYFSNTIIPYSQVKYYTILLSIRQKSPELIIPEKIFCDAIQGKSIYVKEKDEKNKLMKGITIYDYTEGFNEISVIVADSGRILSSSDKKYLTLRLYNGISYGNLKGNNNRARDANAAVQYMRQSFDLMEMLIEFDGTFEMRSDAMYKDRHIGKNLASLQQSIDSMTVRIDSIKERESKALYNLSYKRSFKNFESQENLTMPDLENPYQKKTVNFDSLYTSQDEKVKVSLLEFSKRSIDNIRMNYDFKSNELRVEDKDIRWHHTEMHRKFTLSFACLIFFFIGAPLGAIIRKGGLGAPAVISVFLFIIYYVIDTTGYKFARDAIWLPWQGMWISSAVLFPLGVFLTYKAVNDSVLLNAETYIDSLKRLMGHREYRKIEKKEIILEKIDYNEVGVLIRQLKTTCLHYISNNKRWLHYHQFWKSGGIDDGVELIVNQMENVIEILKNSDQNIVLNKIMDFPVINNYGLTNLRISGKMGFVLAVVFPVGGFIYLIATYRRKLLHRDITTTAKICEEIESIIDDHKMEL